jgi:DNA-binding NarL/FixJ family response regulator
VTAKSPPLLGRGGSQSRSVNGPASGRSRPGALAVEAAEALPGAPSAEPAGDHAHGARPIRVVLVDDQPFYRAWLRAAFDADRRIEVVGEAADGAGLLEILPATGGDVILLDLVMPGQDGLHVLEALARRRHGPPVVVMSAHDDAGHVDRALALGAQGYVVKGAEIDEIVLALTHALSGGIYLQPVIAKAVVQRHLLLSDASEGGSDDLSRRQLELLRALANGMTNKEIASLLDLAPMTVNDYMKVLFARLGVASRAAAVGTGMRRGLIE